MLREEDDHSSSIKARIAPHQNEDSIRMRLKTERCMCSPTGVRIVLSFESLKKWRLSKAEVKSAFLQTGKVRCDVYVIPSCESGDRALYWLLLIATYGLVSANSRWRDQSDPLMLHLGCIQVAVVPHLFYIIIN